MAVAFWILVWEAVSLAVSDPLFLPSPWAVVKALLSLLSGKEFYSSLWFSSSRIAFSYFLAFVLAMAVGTFASLSENLAIFLSPLVKAIRSIPVASIVILVLLWVRSRNLSMVVSVLVVFPILYESVVSGIKSVDRKLMEAAEVYGVKGWRKLWYYLVPSVFPYVKNGVKTSLGLAWKSAVAAEVIALPQFSVGSYLYEAKVYLDSPSLFAWTVVIVVAAAVFEGLMLFILSRMEKVVLR